MENNMSAKTAPLADRRDARMTEDEMAAFIENREPEQTMPGGAWTYHKLVGTMPERACSTVVTHVCVGFTMGSPWVHE